MSATSKLLTEWQGPYQAVKRVGKVNYQVDIHNRRKRKRIFDANMLRPWYVSEDKSYFAEEFSDTEQELEDVPV